MKVAKLHTLSASVTISSKLRLKRTLTPGTSVEAVVAVVAAPVVNKGGSVVAATVDDATELGVTEAPVDTVVVTLVGNTVVAVVVDAALGAAVAPVVEVVVAWQKLLKLPPPTPTVPGGHVATQAPRDKKRPFLQVRHVARPLSAWKHSKQSMRPNEVQRQAAPVLSAMPRHSRLCTVVEVGPCVTVALVELDAAALLLTVPVPGVVVAAVVVLAGELLPSAVVVVSVVVAVIVVVVLVAAKVVLVVVLVLEICESPHMILFATSATNEALARPAYASAVQARSPGPSPVRRCTSSGPTTPSKPTATT